jgi:hypothetical protein
MLRQCRRKLWDRGVKLLHQVFLHLGCAVICQRMPCWPWCAT